MFIYLLGLLLVVALVRRGVGCLLGLCDCFGFTTCSSVCELGVLMVNVVSMCFDCLGLLT